MSDKVSVPAPVTAYGNLTEGPEKLVKSGQTIIVCEHGISRGRWLFGVAKECGFLLCLNYGADFTKALLT